MGGIESGGQMCAFKGGQMGRDGKEGRGSGRWSGGGPVVGGVGCGPHMVARLETPSYFRSYFQPITVDILLPGFGAWVGFYSTPPVTDNPHRNRRYAPNVGGGQTRGPIDMKPSSPREVP